VDRPYLTVSLSILPPMETEKPVPTLHFEACSMIPGMHAVSLAC